MMEQVFLGNSSLAGVREMGGFGQPLHLLYPQIRAVLTNELGPETASILADPVVDRTGNRIDWYTQGDPDHPPVGLNTLPDDQRQTVLNRIEDFLRRGRELAERYTASADPRRVQLGALLQAALHPPAETDIFLVHDQPVIIGWAFALDRPWDIAAGSGRRPASSLTESATGAPHDGALPDTTMPQLANAAVLEATAPAAEPPPELPPPLPAPLPKPVMSPIQAESPPLSEPVATTVAVDPVLESASLQPDGSGRSRWWWLLIALVVLLALLAAYWWTKSRSSPPIMLPTPGRVSATDPGRASTPVKPVDVQPSVIVPPPAVDQRTHPEPSPPAPGSAPVIESAVPNLERASAIPPVPTPPAAGGRLETTPQFSHTPAGETGAGRDAKVSAPVDQHKDQQIILSNDRAAGGPQPAAEQPPAAALPLDSSSPKVTVTPPALASRPPVAGEQPKTLEEALGGESVSAASSQRQPLAAPPIKADPTPEERREFASRMSATGAATGEITATLLWNSPGDLDLVVCCPSGQPLDYRNSSGCGGTLDVDANAARTSLSQRPVENVFWPAGKAAPGNYQIVVRYAPRKDEQNPGETPFQVRLIRGGQESVFKGAIRPNTQVPITTFTVEP